MLSTKRLRTLTDAITLTCQIDSRQRSRGFLTQFEIEKPLITREFVASFYPNTCGTTIEKENCAAEKLRASRALRTESGAAKILKQRAVSLGDATLTTSHPARRGPMLACLPQSRPKQADLPRLALATELMREVSELQARMVLLLKRIPAN